MICGDVLEEEREGGEKEELVLFDGGSCWERGSRGGRGNKRCEMSWLWGVGSVRSTDTPKARLLHASFLHFVLRFFST